MSVLTCRLCGGIGADGDGAPCAACGGCGIVLVPLGGPCVGCGGAGRTQPNATAVCAQCRGSGMSANAVVVRMDQAERAIPIAPLQRLARRLARDTPRIVGGRPLYRRHLATHPITLPDRDHIHRRALDSRAMIGFPSVGGENLAELAPPAGPMPLSTSLMPAERWRIGGVGPVLPRLLVSSSCGSRRRAVACHGRSLRRPGKILRLRWHPGGK